jgi:hypothetical protein
MFRSPDATRPERQRPGASRCCGRVRKDSRTRRVPISTGVQNLAFGADPHLLLLSADPAGPLYVPDLLELATQGRGGWAHDESLEAVLATMVARVRPGDTLCAVQRDLPGQTALVSDRRAGYEEDGVVRLGSAAGVRGEAVSPPLSPVARRSSRNPPNAPITPDASAGRNMVVPLP